MSLTSRTRYNASQVLQFLFASGEPMTQREMHYEVSIVPAGSTPLSDAVRTLVRRGLVNKIVRPGKEALYQIN